MTEQDTAAQEHLWQIAQAEFVAQPPERDEGDDVGRVLRSVERGRARTGQHRLPQVPLPSPHRKVLSVLEAAWRNLVLDPEDYTCRHVCYQNRPAGGVVAGQHHLGPRWLASLSNSQVPLVSTWPAASAVSTVHRSSAIRLFFIRNSAACTLFTSAKGELYAERTSEHIDLQHSREKKNLSQGREEAAEGDRPG
jgi:hypothetical protein